MKTTRQQLIQDLRQRTKALVEQAQAWENEPLQSLQQQPAAKRWSSLACLEHLNLYGDFYLPLLQERIAKAPLVLQAETFKSGWLGNYAVKSMLPNKQGQIKKMKTFKDKDPMHDDLDKAQLQRFIQQQKQFLEVLEKAAQVDCKKVKVPTTLGRWIRFRLGDLLRFLVAHNERHIAQAQRALAQAKAV